MSGHHDLTYDLVQAIAAADGNDSGRIEYPLYDHIDLDAVKALAVSNHTGWMLTFQVPDHVVEIRGTGEILIDDTLHRDRNGKTIRETD